MPTLLRRVYDGIVHRASGNDDEVCGVLAGAHGAGESRAVDLYPATTAAATPATRHLIDPGEQLAIVAAIDADGHDVVGFDHGHPRGPPGPSGTDAARATWEGYSHVICALDDHPCVGSWRWDGEAFRREAVAVVRDWFPGGAAVRARLPEERITARRTGDRRAHLAAA